MDRKEAAAALDAVHHSERELARHASWPLWRHAAYGFIQALLVAGIALPTWIGGVCIALALLLVALIVRDDKRRHGMFVSGWQPGRTQIVTCVGVLIVFAGVATVWLAGIDRPASPAFIGIVAAVFALSTAVSLWWEKVYRAELSGAEA